MRIYQRRPGGVWWADLGTANTPRGCSPRFSTGTRDRAAAAEFAAKTAADRWRQVRLGEQPRVTWDEAALRFIEERRGLKDLEGLKLRLRWVTPILTGMPIDAINAAVLRDLAARKAAEPALRRHPPKPGEKPKQCSGATVNRYLAAVSAVLNAARKRGELVAVPHVAWRAEAPHRDVDVTPEQLERLLAELPDHLRALARFSLATGLRETNARLLEWSRVDLERRVAWFPGQIMKNGKPLAIPLNAAALEVLSAQQGLHRRWVFVYRGKPVTKATNTAWRNARQRAGLAHLRWHDLRHAWAQAHVLKGTPVRVLQAMGGWRDERMVGRYAVLQVDWMAGFADLAVPGTTPAGTKAAQAPGNPSLGDDVTAENASVIKGMDGVADGIRTHNNWNHNPEEAPAAPPAPIQINDLRARRKRRAA